MELLDELEPVVAPVDFELLLEAFLLLELDDDGCFTIPVDVLLPAGAGGVCEVLELFLAVSEPLPALVATCAPFSRATSPRCCTHTPPPISAAATIIIAIIDNTPRYLVSPE